MVVARSRRARRRPTDVRAAAARRRPWRRAEPRGRCGDGACRAPRVVNDRPVRPRTRCRTSRAARRCGCGRTRRATGPTRPRRRVRARRRRPSSSTRCRVGRATGTKPTHRSNRRGRRRRRAPLVTRGPVHRVDGVRVMEAVREPRRVGEQVPDAHRLGRGLGDRRERGAALVDAHVGERRDQRADRILELERALFVEHHRGDRRDRFRHRVDAPQRVELDRQPGFLVAVAARRDVGDPTVAAHDQRPTGEPAVVDVAAKWRSMRARRSGAKPASVGSISVFNSTMTSLRSGHVMAAGWRPYLRPSICWKIQPNRRKEALCRLRGR